MRERRQIVVFAALTFGWAWLLWGYWVVAMPPGGLELSPAFLASALLGGLAPSLAALIVTAWSSGKAGVGALLGRFRRGRSGAVESSVALLLVPALGVIAAALQASFVGPLRWPEPGLLAMALVWPLLAALGEEIGWRGYMLPRLENRMGLLPAALLIGVIWGVWHLPADYVGLKAYGDWFWAAFLVNGPVVLTAHSVIMAWLHRRSGGNLMVQVLYHWSITASAIALPATGSAGASGVVAAGIGAALMWVAAGALLLLRRDDFGQAALGSKVSATPFMQ